MTQGTVKWFNGAKGFGFIVLDSGGPDMFVHQSDVQGAEQVPLREGQRVEFDVADGERGPKAREVHPI